MDQSRQNWKLVVRIHQVLLGIVFLTNLLVHGELKKITLVLLVTVALSLFIQALVYAAKFDWYGDKTKKHPHVVLKKL